MQNIKITRESEFEPTFKTESLKAKFDLHIDKTQETFELDVDLPEAWGVGVIYGASGTGKSTLLQHLFGEHMYQKQYGNKPIVEEINSDRSIDEITDAFNKVGFSSPPSWLKPYHVLSNGEKMRVDLAERVLNDSKIIAFDEFTSVVDRNVAQICSLVVAKYVRKHGKSLVVATCHEDVIRWLQPDWIIDTNEMRFIRPVMTGLAAQLSSSKYDDVTESYGESLGSITI